MTAEHPAGEPSAPEQGRGPGVGAPLTEWPTGRLLSTAARRVDRAWDAYLDQWSLSHSSLPVLAVLAGGPRSQNELAREMDVTEQTMSRMLVRLEHAEYVRRDRHPGDRRRHIVAITGTGRSCLTALNDTAAIEGLAAPHLAPEQVHQLRGLLIALLSDPGAQV